MKRYEDPKWTAGMRLGLDHNYAMAESVGENGLRPADLAALAPRLQALEQSLAEQRQNGPLGFLELPPRHQPLKEIRQVVKPLTEWVWDVVVLGLGGSALAARALQQALCHPQYNKLPMGRRQHHPGLWVADNIDPDFLFGLLDGLELRRTGFAVISKSGDTLETLAQFAWAYRLLKSRIGADEARERFIITTDPEQGALRRLANEARFPALAVPPEVPGRFSILTAVGLLPAALVGIDLEELLAGARFMRERLRLAAPEDNLAYRLAALYYLFGVQKSRSILVLMPYASSLAGLMDWCSYLWSESLGKQLDLKGREVRGVTTPVRSQGITDQHSQLQLYLDGPEDKLITFVEVGKFKHHLEIPDPFAEPDTLAYLNGQTLAGLLQTERKATAFNLRKARRPSLTLHLPEINAFTVGQLIYLWQVVTVATAELYGVDPLSTPGVAGGKQTTYGLLNRPGFEKFGEEFAAAPPALEDYLLS